jgi:hypothetical protein
LLGFVLWGIEESPFALTEVDRTLFFVFLPLFGGTFAAFFTVLASCKLFAYFHLSRLLLSTYQLKNIDTGVNY